MSPPVLAEVVSAASAVAPSLSHFHCLRPTSPTRRPCLCAGFNLVVSLCYQRFLERACLQRVRERGASDVLICETMPGKSKFQPTWLHHDYKHWIAPDSTNPHRAKCKLCGKTFDVTAMGESALKSLMKSAEYIGAIKMGQGLR